MNQIQTAEEFKKYVESDDDIEFSKTQWEASDEVWFDVLERYPKLSRNVACNNTISMNVLSRLAESDDWMVRCDVAEKRRISREIFEKLSTDPKPGIRIAIAVNRKVPKDILVILSSDPDESVAEAAKERLQEL